MKLDDRQLENLLRTLAVTHNLEIDCGECLATVSAYAENELAGKTPGEALARVQQHLSVCADCREEYHALLKALREIHGSGPS
jgi:uncharacterized protein with PIN domain